MFTGLVREVALLEKIEFEEEGASLQIKMRLPSADLELGASVAVNGVCLTVTSAVPVAGDGSGGAGHCHIVSFFVGRETLARSAFAELKEGDLLNIEPALRQGDPLGGHWVQGHVDGCACVVCWEKQGESQFLTLSLDAPLLKWVVPQGSIAVKGVSLTVAEKKPAEGHIVLMLIPHTLAATNLKNLKEGERVEVECDTQVKTIVQTVEHVLPELFRSGDLKALLRSNLAGLSGDV